MVEEERTAADLLIDKIEEIRKENNRNWMRLLRIAFREAPDEAGEVITKIGICDAKINALTKELAEESRKSEQPPV